MLTDFNQPIITNYSPISSKGGSKARRSRIRKPTRKPTRKLSTRKRKFSNKSRTRRRYR
jgi:hypothetical protein